MVPTTEYQRLEFEKVGDVTVVRLLDRLLNSHLTIVETGQELFRLADQSTPQHMVLDLCAVQSLSSVMLGKLIELKNQLWSRGARLVLTGVSDSIRDVLRVAKVERIFDIKCSQAEALASF